MNTFNINLLTYIIVILFILLIIVKITTNSNKTHSNSTIVYENFNNNKELQDTIKEKIDMLMKARNDLKTEFEKPEKKANYKKQYYKQIEQQINDKLEENNTYLKENNIEVTERLQKIRDNMKYVHTVINLDMDDKQYNSIKSLQNGSRMALIPISDKKNTYLIKMNTSKYKSGYVTANDNGDICIKSKINLKDDKQLFEIIEIKNESMYKNNLDKGLLVNQFYNTDNIIYPFSLIKSKYNKNCLQNYNNNLSLITCKPFKSHRYEPSKDKILCNE